MSQHAGEVYPGVTVNPNIMQGKPVLTGTRIPVELIVGQLAGGETFETVGVAYRVTDEQIRTALGYAAQLLASETVYVVSPS